MSDHIQNAIRLEKLVVQQAKIITDLKAKKTPVPDGFLLVPVGELEKIDHVLSAALKVTHVELSQYQNFGDNNEYQTLLDVLIEQRLDIKEMIGAKDE